MRCVPMKDDPNMGKLVKTIVKDGCRIEIWDGGYAGKTEEELAATRKRIQTLAWRIAVNIEQRRREHAEGSL